MSDKPERCTVRFDMLMEPSTREALNELASDEGITPSHFIRSLIIEAKQKRARKRKAA